MVLKIRPQSDSVFIIWNQWFLLTKTDSPPLFILTLQIQNSTLQYHIKAPDSTPSYNFTWNWFGCLI